MLTALKKQIHFNTSKTNLAKHQSRTMASQNPYGTGDDPYDYDYQPFASKADNKSTLLKEANNKDIEEESVKLRMKELEEREKQLEEREKQLRANEGKIQEVKKPNWPRCYPLVYHSIFSIESKIRRNLAIMGYVGWFAFSVLVILNFIAMMISLSPFLPPENPNDSIGNNLEKVQYGFVSAMIMLCGIPCHFFVSYWSLYKAMETVNILRFLIFFVTYLIPVVFCIFGFVGLYNYGVCGLLLVIAAWPPALGGGGNLVVWIVNIIMMFLWVIVAVYFAVIFLIGIYVFKTQNHTFKKAKDVLQSEVVKGVTTTISKTVTSSLSGGSREADASSSQV